MIMKDAVSTNMRRGAALVLAASLAAVAGSVQAAPKNGGTLTVGLETDVRGFDTVKGGVYGVSGRTVAGAIEEPLLMYTPDGQWKPFLATSWSNSDDGLTWTVKLREGVKFHDGSDFDASDVAAHYNRILDPKNKSRSRGFITAIKGAAVVDAHTVRFTLAHPWQGFLPTIGGRDMASLIESPEQTAAGKQNRSPIGTGPYIFQEWRGGDRLIVTKNPNYWDKDKIHLDKIVYRILPDPQTRFQSLKAGDVDVIWTDRANSIISAKKDKSLNVFEQNGGGSNLLLLNASKPPLDNEIVRQAVNFALSQKISNKVLYKDTRPFVEHPMPFKCGDVSYPAHSLEKAKALVKQYGKPIKLQMIHTTTPRGREGSEIHQQLLKKAGIELELVPVDQSILVKRVFTNKYMMSGWRIADAIDVGAQLFGLSYSKSPYNITRHKTKELDMLSLGMRTAKDQKTREAMQCKMAAYINKTGNMAFGQGNRYYIISQPKVKGMRGFSYGTAYVWYMWKDNG
ncbi:MAG: ABC transporter substrate-binding protein [Alphaproteobacteria bacterium]|nr:ABC transporter substrate-binding protein [Alphaproteobacteria bacterium]